MYKQYIKLYLSDVNTVTYIQEDFFYYEPGYISGSINKRHENYLYFPKYNLARDKKNHNV